MYELSYTNEFESFKYISKNVSKNVSKDEKEIWINSYNEATKTCNYKLANYINDQINNIIIN